MSESPPGDPLGEALHALRLTGAFYCRTELSAPYGVALPAFPGSLMFHIMTSGRCWLVVEGEAPVLLQPGDLALVPHGRGHRLQSDPDVLAKGLFDIEREAISSCYEVLRHGGGGAETTMLCGVVDFEHPAARQLIGVLPQVVKVDAWHAPEAAWLESTLRFIQAEARALKPGGETIITRLCDVLVIQAIRAWIASVPAAEAGWVGALQDEQIGRAIAHVHRIPEHPWTVALLAEKAAMSRSAFSQRFTELVGESPMRYVTRWRMHVARTWLAEGDVSTAEAAHRLGYGSEAAFSRAFKRMLGVSPGAVRRGTTAAASEAEVLSSTAVR